MLSLYRTSALQAVGPLKAGIRPIATSAVLMAKKKEIDPSLPTVPKAPASAYTLFVKKWFTDNRQSVTADGAKMSLKSIAGQMGQAWNDLAEASKDEYTKQAKDLKTTYDKEYKNFLEGLSPESIKAIEAATGKKLRIPGGKKARSRELSRASGSPGKPLTAFFEFMRDFREKEGGEGEGKEKVTLVAKRAGEKWNSMSEGEKQEWKDKAAANKAKYDEWYKSQHQQ